MEIFRKSALDKLSSPDQLDRMIIVISPMTWLIAIGGFIIVCASLIWGIFGKLPQNVESTGIIISGEGTDIIYSDTSGIIDKVMYDVGDYVEKGQVIAYIDAQNIYDEISMIDKRIKGVDVITLDSEGDVSTADNKSLMDIKAELIPLMTTLNQAERNLKVVDGEIAFQNALVNDAKEDMEIKKQDYYLSINDKSGAKEQADYSEWQSTYSTTQSYVENTKQNLENAKVSIDQAQIQKNMAEEQYGHAEEMADQKLDEYNNALMSLELYDRQLKGEEMKENPDYTQIQKLKNKITQMEEVTSTLEQEYQKASTEAETLRNEYDVAEANVEAAEIQYEAISRLNDEYNGRLGYENQRYTDSKEAYIESQDNAAAINKYSNVANNEYNWALNTYSNEKNTLDNLKQSRVSAEVEVESAREQVEAKKKVLEKSFNATKEAILDNLELEKDKLNRNLKRAEIVATKTGFVNEVVVTEGGVVQAGGEVIKVINGDALSKEAICYVPIAYGKKIKPNMEVMIYPTTVNKQECGHMVGVVKSVDSYVTSQAELSKRVGDTTLVESFLRSGPVVEVICELKVDEDTASGFYWSSPKGKNIQIDEGTIISANIVVDKKAPISLVIPLLKEKLTIVPMQQDQNSK